jgi:hypothetical protein
MWIKHKGLEPLQIGKLRYLVMVVKVLRGVLALTEPREVQA